MLIVEDLISVIIGDHRILGIIAGFHPAEVSSSLTGLSMHNCPYCNKNLKSWSSVRGHVSTCPLNSGEYHIDNFHGALHYSVFVNKTAEEVRIEYPRLASKITDISKHFRKKGIDLNCSRKYYTVDELLQAIRDFYKENNRIPQNRDFDTNSKYPSTTPYKDHFGSWNEAIKLAGFKPNENDGFGSRILAKDGVLYRSWYETEFVNKFLYGKEEYTYEVKYPNHNKYYDFYLPKRDLYIEIDGGCRPSIMEEKIQINKNLGRNLLVIKTSEFNKFTGFD